MSEERNGLNESEIDDIDPDDAPEDELDDEPIEGDEPEDQPIEPAVAEPQRRPGRAERERARRREVEQQLEQEREARIRAEERANTRSTYQPPQIDHEAEARREQEQLALMSPDQIARYFYEKGQRETRQTLLQMQIQTGDQIDRQGFERFCERYPAASRIAGQVETVLVAERNQGRNPTRETVAKYLLGDELLKRATREGDRQRRNGRDRITRETTRPGNSRSTAATPAARRGGGNSEVEIYERIKDIPLW